jgi:peroxiredoxin
MFGIRKSWVAVVATGLGLACGACQSETTQTTQPVQPPPAPKTTETRPAVKPVEPSHAVKHAPKAEHHAAAPKPKRPVSPPPPATIPKVVLSDALRTSCVIKVGDTMPEAELPDPAGKTHALESLYGQKLTVVSIWTNGATPRSHTVARASLHDLMKDIVQPFGKKGVKVIGINIGDANEAVQQQVTQAGVSFPILLDPKGDYLAKVAKDKKMPRTYLLDAGGRVLWFDVEYSRSSRQELVQSIRVVLGEL